MTALRYEQAIETLEQRQLRKGLPRFKAGDTVRVHFRVIEGPRPRVQVFEGIVIKRQGAGVRETFTVRKQSFGVGVERTFPLHSPKIEKIEVMQIGDVSRAKLYYLREKVGKKARVRASRRRQATSPMPRAAEELEKLPRRNRGRRESAAEQPRQQQSRRRAEPAEPKPRAQPQAERTGQKLLSFDRRLGASTSPAPTRPARLAGGAARRRGGAARLRAAARPRVRPLALLNDSKQLTARSARSCSTRSWGAPSGSRARDRPRRSTERPPPLQPRRSARGSARADTAGRGMPRRRLPARPGRAGAHRGRRRRRAKRRDRGGLDRREGHPRPAHAAHGALYPHYGFASHVGYITPEHSAVVARTARREIHRRSFQALCYADDERQPTTAGRSRRAYAALPPARVPDPRRERLGGRQRARPRARRGGRLVFCEVKAKRGDALRRPAGDGRRREAAPAAACRRERGSRPSRARRAPGRASTSSAVRDGKPEARARRRPPGILIRAAEGHYPRTDVTRQNGRQAWPGCVGPHGREKPSAVRCFPTFSRKELHT